MRDMKIDVNINNEDIFLSYYWSYFFLFHSIFQ